MISSITKPLTEHLLYLKDEFYLSYQNLELVTNQIYHYFCSPYQFYQQYKNPCFEEFQFTIENSKDEVFMKTLEIGLIASTFYIMFQDSPSQTLEKKRCNQLESLNLKSVIIKFFEEDQFAKDLILGFIQSDFYTEDEMNQKKDRIKQNGKDKVLRSLYPLEPIDQAIYQYQKKKTN